MVATPFSSIASPGTPTYFQADALSYPEPPTRITLDDARRDLEILRQSTAGLNSKIEVAEETLQQLITESRSAIEELQFQRDLLEQKTSRTLAYLSPIRRLPVELLRDVFMWNFELHPCSAWVLASVCWSWRRLVLSMPRIWSKIRLLTSQQASADTIRLWLERSGDSVPLDIEIFLRVGNSGGAPAQEGVPTTSRRRHQSTSPQPHALPIWGLPPIYVTPPTYPIPPPAPVPMVLPPAHTPLIVPAPPPDPWPVPGRSTEKMTSGQMKTNAHWGHITIYYLVQQMHRWERFVFRFDKQFPSVGALKTINGEAPLLREFEVSSAESSFYTDWPWLPNESTTLTFPNLRTLTLQYMPFKYSSSILRPNLTTLNLRSLPAYHLPVDRILGIAAANPSLQHLSMYFQGALDPILPLQMTTLRHVVSFSVGGPAVLSQLVDHLILPQLESLSIDIEPREPIETVITALITRSVNTKLTSLSIAYSYPHLYASSPIYYSPAATSINWSTFLQDVPELKTLCVGTAMLDPLLGSLGNPDDDDNNGMSGLGPGPLPGGSNGEWVCPKLEKLALRSCHGHSESVKRLVRMIESRCPGTSPAVAASASANGGAPSSGSGSGTTGSAAAGSTGGSTTSASSSGPPAGTSSSGGGSGGAVRRLKKLELHDCSSIGQDVMDWLKSKVGDLVCTEVQAEKWNGSPW